MPEGSSLIALAIIVAALVVGFALERLRKTIARGQVLDVGLDRSIGME